MKNKNYKLLYDLYKNKDGYNKRIKYNRYLLKQLKEIQSTADKATRDEYRIEDLELEIANCEKVKDLHVEIGYCEKHINNINKCIEILEKD